MYVEYKWPDVALRISRCQGAEKTPLVINPLVILETLMPNTGVDNCQNQALQSSHFW